MPSDWCAVRCKQTRLAQARARLPVTPWLVLLAPFSERLQYDSQSTRAAAATACCAAVPGIVYRYVVHACCAVHVDVTVVRNLHFCSVTDLPVSCGLLGPMHERARSSTRKKAPPCCSRVEKLLHIGHGPYPGSSSSCFVWRHIFSACFSSAAP